MTDQLLIGIDIDGTLYPWTEATNAVAMERFGYPDPGPHTSWDYLKNTLTEEQFAWIWTEEAAMEVFGRVELIYPGAAEVVNELCEQHLVHFVTHRSPRKTTEATGRWLREYFEGYRGVHTLMNDVNKDELMAWDVFIDDKPETIERFVVTDTLPLMPIRDWNQPTPTGVIHFKEWDEIPSIIRVLV